ncbi:MAG: threonine/serine dehydratase [bacterium]|nr:threonine/serine dehydratase [bacterium]
MSVGLKEIQAAAARIRPIAHRTPVLTSRLFNAAAGIEAHFKCENLQRGGAFKIRGASNLIFSLSKEELARGVVTYSSGNHAQAVAIASESVGATATIVMPDDAPRSKREATEAHGARIVSYNRLEASREALGRQIAGETGAAIVPPYDHPKTIAGQGTTALEFLEDVPDLDALVVCVGGGGLISGCATAANAIRPGIRVIGVEPELANDTYLSVEAGRRVEIPVPSTIADGLRSTSPGELTFPIIERLVERIILVTEDEIRAAVSFLLSRMKILAEPSGAVAAAAALFGKLPPGIERAGIIVSGGNVDLDSLAEMAS